MEIVINSVNVSAQKYENIPESSIKYTVGDLSYFFENIDYIYFLDTNIGSLRQNDIFEIITQINHPTVDTLSKFLPDFLLVIIDKKTSTVEVFRDISGIKTAYYFVENGIFYINNNMHDIAKSIDSIDFDDQSIFDLLYSGYLMEGKSFYKDLNEFPIGSQTMFKANGDIISQLITPHVFAKNDNNLSETANIALLRQEIRKAHLPYRSKKNNILLSGGIDSVAMLIALDDIIDDKKEIHNYAFKVKDTIQDETVFAKSAADYLNVSIDVIEVDAENESNYTNFQEKILSMNNPYSGLWIFGNFQAENKTMFFAGQDTRLHTPAILSIDIFAFKMFFFRKKIIFKLVQQLFLGIRLLLNKYNFDQSKNRIYRGIYRLSATFDIEYYIHKYFFKIDLKKIKNLDLPVFYFEEFKKKYAINIDEVSNPRHLYNEIVKVKWREQYVYDIRYMQDMARINKSYIAMPFYDMSLALFSSSIPWKLATKQFMGRKGYGFKKTIINKFILREALKDKLNDIIYFRGKAVSQTIHQLFNGFLGKIITKILVDDLNSNNSFIHRYHLEDIVNKYLSVKKWELDSEEILLRIHYIAALCIYNTEIVSKKKI